MPDLAEFLLARIAEDEAAYESAYVAYLDGFPFTPTRVLAECEAKRRIVEQCKEWLSYGPVKSWETDRGEDAALSEDAAPTVLRLLALPYTNHPDYREEWRP
jgi:hypothetical protein